MCLLMEPYCVMFRPRKTDCYAVLRPLTFLAETEYIGNILETCGNVAKKIYIIYIYMKSYENNGEHI